jgi:glycosyltransferase involved in cell wall biosynthesis
MDAKHGAMGEGQVDPPERTLFLYWGRRGLSRFTFDLATELAATRGDRWLLSVSRQNEIFDRFRTFKSSLLPIKTFEHGAGAFLAVHRIARLRHGFARQIRDMGVGTVVNLMPHMWSPLVAPTIRRAGMLYVTVVHDADPHPGDPTSVLQGWGLRDILYSNLVVTLSQAVAGRLSATGRVSHGGLLPLFHPDLAFGQPCRPLLPKAGEPFRLLFFGRILPYKGLALLVDALELLAERGVRVELGVYGDGPVEGARERLAAIGATVDNRWIPDHEVADIFGRFHAVVLAHTEASQSGVAAAALGMGLPLIASPVGGLIEQVRDGETGVMAGTADAVGLADAVTRLMSEAGLYARICDGIEKGRPRRCMRAFADSLFRGLDERTAASRPLCGVTSRD